MLISLTGTPGTGKTSVAEHFSDHRVIDLTEYVKKNDLGKQGEEEFEVDVDAMVEKLEEDIEEDEDVLVEGHLSHYLDSDYCVVLRCNPEELRERLEEREYPEKKVEENIEAETLDVILSEAVQEQENVIEIDTTGMEPVEVAEKIKSMIKEEKTGYGEIDWTEYL